MAEELSEEAKVMEEWRKALADGYAPGLFRREPVAARIVELKTPVAA